MLGTAWKAPGEVRLRGQVRRSPSASALSKFRGKGFPESFPLVQPAPRLVIDVGLWSRYPYTMDAGCHTSSTISTYVQHGSSARRRNDLPMKLLFPFRFTQLLLASIISFASLAQFTSAQGVQISDEQIYTVSARLAESANARYVLNHILSTNHTHAHRSWEMGTRAQAILELNATRYSVFNSASLPPPYDVPSDLSDAMQPYWDLAARIMDNWNGTTDGAWSSTALERTFVRAYRVCRSAATTHA